MRLECVLFTKFWALWHPELTLCYSWYVHGSSLNDNQMMDKSAIYLAQCWHLKVRRVFLCVDRARSVWYYAELDLSTILTGPRMCNKTFPKFWSHDLSSVHIFSVSIEINRFTLFSDINSCVQTSLLWTTFAGQFNHCFIFLFVRYYVLMRGLDLSDDPKGRCLLLLQQYDNSSAEWQLGKTKVSNIMFSGYSLWHVYLCG